MIISEHYNNRAFSVIVGKPVVLQLPENPTTGYSWDSAEWSFPDSVDLLLNEYKSLGSAVGSGGYRRWVLQPNKVGTFTFQLGYQRAWEDHPIKTFQFQLVVEPEPEPEMKPKDED